MRGLPVTAADLGILDEVPHEPVRGVLVEQCVAVDADQDLVLREQRAGLQRDRLALVLAPGAPRAAAGASPPAVQHVAGFVLAAVVDGDDLEIRIVERERVAQRLFGIVLLVVSRGSGC